MDENIQRLMINRLLEKYKFFENGNKCIMHIEDLSEISNITKIDLSNQSLFSIPEWIKYFINVKEINLNNNNITKIKNLDKLIYLETLYLGENDISKIEGLDNCVNLETFDCYKNKITKIEGLNSCINLKFLDLGENTITNIENINNNIILEEICLGKNNIEKIEGLEDCINLTTLILNNNKIIKIENIEKLKKLETLNLADNEILTINKIDLLDNLESIDLSNNKIKTINNIENLLNYIGEIEKNRCYLKVNSTYLKYSKYKDEEFKKNLYIDFNADNLNKKYEIRKLKIMKALNKKYLKNKRKFDLKNEIKEKNEINFGY